MSINQTGNTEHDDENDSLDLPMRPRIDMLKDKARRMGLSFSPNIGEDTLANKIQEHETKTQGLLDETAEEAAADTGVIDKRTLRIRARRNAQKLIRVNITPNDPMRIQMLGELIFTGNAEIGTLGKFVPFGTPKGFHIPVMIYNIMKERTYTHYRYSKDAQGNEITTAVQRAAFNIEVLEPLTAAQIKRIADRQLLQQQWDEEHDTENDEV